MACLLAVFRSLKPEHSEQWARQAVISENVNWRVLLSGTPNLFVSAHHCLLGLPVSLPVHLIKEVLHRRGRGRGEERHRTPLAGSPFFPAHFFFRFFRRDAVVRNFPSK